MRRVFVCFLGESSARKNRFEIYWPLSKAKELWKRPYNYFSRFRIEGQNFGLFLLSKVQQKSTLSKYFNNRSWSPILIMFNEKKNSEGFDLKVRLSTFWRKSRKYFSFTDIFAKMKSLLTHVGKTPPLRSHYKQV